MNAVGITPELGNFIIVIVVALVLKSILGFGALAYIGWTVARLATRLRVEVFDALFRARWSYYADKKLGTIANAISNDAARAADAYSASAQFAAGVVQTVTYALVGVLIDWKFGLVGILISTLVALSLSRVVRSSGRAGKRQFSRISDLTVVVTDIIGNVKPIKTMDRFTPGARRHEQENHVAAPDTVEERTGSRRTRLTAASRSLRSSSAAALYLASRCGNFRSPRLMVMSLVFYQIVNITNKTQKVLQSAVEVEGAYWRVLESDQGGARRAGNPHRHDNAASRGRLSLQSGQLCPWQDRHRPQCQL